MPKIGIGIWAKGISIFGEFLFKTESGPPDKIRTEWLRILVTLFKYLGG